MIFEEMSLSIGKRCRALTSLSYEHVHSTSTNKGLDDEDEETAPSIHTFLLGSTMLNEENELFTIEYDEESKKLTQKDVRSHPPGELWEIEAHPKEKLIVSCWCSPSEGRGLAVSTDDSIVSHIEGGSGARALTFENKSSTNLASVHDDGTCKIWKFIEGDLTPVVERSIRDEQNTPGKDVAWDQNTANLVIAATGGKYCRVLDSREGKETGRIETGTRCHSVDLNPNRPHFLLTAGEDGIIKFWDARKSSETIQTLSGGHRHWVTKARYNPFHDQLVISSSTDGTVCLWRAASVSSAPLLDLDSDEDEDSEKRLENKKQVQDALVRCYDENQDSVYGLTWSAVNAWVFASLCYDGKLNIQTVPGGEKYKILL